MIPQPLPAKSHKETNHLRIRIKSIQAHAISSESDLIALRRGLSLWKFSGHLQITLLLPELDSVMRLHYEKTLNCLLRECGCSWGAAFTLVTLGTVVTVRVINASGTSVPYVLMSALLALALMVPAGVLGKVSGILRAKRRFERTCVELQNTIAACHSPSRTEGMSNFTQGGIQHVNV